MKDGIIAETGNSRLIRANLPATYEEMREMAAAGNLPMDILFNAAGWSQQPDFLNKATLLKDATAAMFGLGESASPDDVFALVKSLIDANRNSVPQIAIGSYVGTDGGQTIPVGFTPDCVIVYGTALADDAFDGGVATPIAPDVRYVGKKDHTVLSVVDGGFWAGRAQFADDLFGPNAAGQTYRYIAIKLGVNA